MQHRIIACLFLLAAFATVSGQTLSPAVPLVQAEPTRSREYPKMQQNAAGVIGYQRQPRTAIAADGSLHLVWTDLRPSDTQVATYYAHSTDDGRTWTARRLISDTLDPRHQDFSYVAVDANNTVYVSYLSGLKGTSDGYQHVFMRSLHGSRRNVRSTDPHSIAAVDHRYVSDKRTCHCP